MFRSEGVIALASRPNEIVLNAAQDTAEMNNRKVAMDFQRIKCRHPDG